MGSMMFYVHAERWCSLKDVVLFYAHAIGWDGLKTCTLMSVLCACPLSVLTLSYWGAEQESVPYMATVILTPFLLSVGLLTLM